MVSPLAFTLISRKIKYAKLNQVFTTTTAAASAAATTPTNYYYYYDDDNDYDDDDDDDDDDVYNSKHLPKYHNKIKQSDQNQLKHNNDVQSTFIIVTYHVFQHPEKTKMSLRLKKLRTD